jgi:hypothetical protein
VRPAFFTLLFVNLVYFAWAHWIDAPRPAPVNDAIGHLPRLKMADESPAAERPAARASKTAFGAATVCLSVGPFADLANSDRAAALLKARGFDPRQRAEPSPISASYWVYVAGLATQADADRALVTLERNGIKDALVMPDAEAGRRLSLGLYTERPRAERRAEAVQQAGLKAEIAERKVPGALYWLDVAPPAGMNTVPIQDLITQGVSSRVGVQPCAPGAAAGRSPATGTAAAAPAAVTKDQGARVQ